MGLNAAFFEVWVSTLLSKVSYGMLAFAQSSSDICAFAGFSKEKLA
jgi:hypothetical protein